MPSTPALFRSLLAVSTMLFLSACSPKSGVPQPSNPASGKPPLAGEAKQDARELQRIESLVHGGAARAGVYATPSDAEIKQAYERLVSGFPVNEVHVVRILVPTERMAKSLIAAIGTGREFEKLAREESAHDPRAKAGDLGWVSIKTLPVPLVTALQALKPGQVAPHPIQTGEGWHVVKLVAARSTAAPPYEQVKSQLIVSIEQQRYEQFLADSLTRKEN